MSVLSAVVSVMTVYSADTEMQAAGCDALAVLSYDRRENDYTTTDLRDLGVCDLIMQALSISEQDTTLVNSACKAMSTMAFFREFGSIFGEKGACSAIGAALKMHLRADFVFDAASSLCKNNPMNCKRLLAADIWTIITTLMNKHRDYLASNSRLCELIYSLIHYSSNKAETVQQMNGARTAVVTAMQTDGCRGQWDVAEFGSAALSYLVEFDRSTPNTQLECQVLVAAMRHLCSGEFTDCRGDERLIGCIQTMTKLVKIDSSCIPRLVDAKIHEAIAKSHYRYPGYSFDRACTELESSLIVQQSKHNW
jgi:hypothetical protein